MIKNKLSFFEKIKLIPITTVVLIGIIASIGFVLMYDAALGNFNVYARKQIVYFLLFLPVMLLIILIDLKWILFISYYIYIIALAFLIAGSIIGHKAMGAVRWVDIGIFKFQPSEVMKIGIVLALARYFHGISYDDSKKIRHLLLPLIMVAIPLGIVVKQPDLGTAIVIGIVAVVIFYLVGINMMKFFITGIATIAAMPIIWNHLHDYQKKRILIFFNPESDPLGSGYNIIQSKIAIGSGGFLGKGRLEATQANLNFLPEHQTDFIFPLFAEEFGFLGALVLLVLFFILIVRVSYAGMNCRNLYGRLVVYGLISIFTSHVLINLGMVMGLLPVVGIPLPLLSSGGTSMGIMLIAFGIIMNIEINSREKIFINKLGYFS